MTDETRVDESKRLWQEQPLEGMSMSLKEVHARIEKLGRAVRRRNLIGGFACVVVVLGFAYFFVALSNTTERLERVGAALTVIGAGYIMGQLVVGKMKTAALYQGQAQASLAFYRSELQRQRDFHQGFWFWSRLIAFVPGPFIFCAGVAKANPGQAWPMTIEAVLVAVLLIAAIPMNGRLARKYQRELDESAG